jgi:hypothetical protein
MTVNHSIDRARLIEEQLTQASTALLRHLLTLFINTLMATKAGAVCAPLAAQPVRTGRTTAKATGIDRSIHGQ